MTKRRGQQPATRPSPGSSRWWPWAVLGVVVVVAGAGLGVWWSWQAPSAAGGPPRLVVDRDTVDFGYVRFGAPAHAVFTVSNTGTGPLVLREKPEVILAKGC